MPKIITTLNRIRACHPCHDGWTKLLTHLGKTKADDEPLDLLTVLESNGLDDTLWCFQAEPDHGRAYRAIAVKFARQVEHLMTDQRSRDALNVAERHSRGEATDEELAAARDAAWDAARAAAWDAARAAAWAAAWAAARDAAWAAAWAAARDAARDAAWAAQTEILRAFLSSED